MARIRFPIHDHLRLAVLTLGVLGVMHAAGSAALAEERAFNPPDLNIPGIGFQTGWPPDTVGEVGSNHYIQMTNSSVVQIFDKNGTPQGGTFLLESLADAADQCAGNGGGDPIVLYDELADRWLMSEFIPKAVGNRLCVYISATNVPTSNPNDWFFYGFNTPNFPDYPKYAVWPDAYYVSTNESSSAAYALDRTNMLQGLPARPPVRETVTDLAGFPFFQALIPSDLDGPAPPAGSPNFFMRHHDDEVHDVLPDPTQDFLDIWAFSPDFDTPANSTFTQLTSIPVAEFDSDLCGLSSFFCFPQPLTNTTLDPLREVIMWRLQYRNFGTHETLVGNFVTDVTGNDQGGIRWFELRRTPPGSGAWTLFQEGTYAPDTDNRWMGSIAMDQAGNIALGYSVSSATTFPSIRYTGQLATDPLGTMTLGEVTVVNGQFSQIGNTRWGDYSSMNVDPVDGCTFWYTNEFVGDGQDRWDTQIARFDIPGCLNEPPVCDADGPYVAECAGPTTDVMLDGTGSSDPGNDPLTFEWSGVFGIANGPTPTVPFPLGAFTADLTVDDGQATDSCSATVIVEDTTPPLVACNSPATIVPPDTPISFTATATDTCEGDLTAVITEFDCFKFTKKGKRIDKTESCMVAIDGDVVTIEDSGGVGDNITWTVVASDGSGNTTVQTCVITVENPGKGN
jgi:hypothetical protein